MGVLHIFDMDGTLIRGSTASLQVADALGRREELLELESRFATREIDTREFATALRRLWHDLTPAIVEKAFHTSPWIAGIQEIIKDIQDRGEHSIVITMSPDFFARQLLDWGFVGIYASTFPPLPFTSPIEPDDILTPAEKVNIVEAFRARLDLPLSRCVAYGDSMSDAPLFRHLSATIAVNADDALERLAAISYHGPDLFEAYRLGRSLLGQETATGSL